MKTTDDKKTLNGEAIKENRWVKYVYSRIPSKCLSNKIVSFDSRTHNLDCAHSFLNVPDFKKFIQLAKENISVGLELETANVSLWEILRGTYASKHTESSKIMEYEMEPCDIGDVKTVAQYGEYIRICNPFHIKGGYEDYSGSAHCHVNVVPFIDKIKKVDCDMEIQTSNYWENKEQYHAYSSADLLANPVMLAMLTPFTSMSYLKKYGVKIPFREKSHLLKNTYDCNGRGYGIMINTDTTYARYGLEYRLNENTHLWVYLIPYLAWKIQHNLIANENEFIDVKNKLSDTHYRVTTQSIGSKEINELHAKVSTLKDMTKKYIDVYEMAWLYDWSEEEVEIFKAYIDEDIEKYESLIYTDKLNSIRQRVYKLYHSRKPLLTLDEDAFNNWVSNEASKYDAPVDVPTSDAQSDDISLRDEFIESITNTHVEAVIMQLFNLIDDYSVRKVRLLLSMTNDNKLFREYIKQLIPDVKFVRKTSTLTLTSDTVVITDNTFAEYNCNTYNAIRVLNI